jgi:cathepsin A (carboxypeptidase C)
MATNLPRCLELGEICYDHPDPVICAAAIKFCEYGVINYYDGESGKGGRNRFDSKFPQPVKSPSLIRVFVLG